MSSIKIEEKLFQNRYLVDADNSHICIKDASKCITQCSNQPCTICCPAGCYTREEQKVVLITDGCLECGTCRIICPAQNLEWEYPRGGYGIQFKFG